MSSNSTRSKNPSPNSTLNSKRTINSQSSTSTNGNNKKKTANQKTLGVAWGSNSLSSSRSSFRSAPFSDFGSYMAVKNKKLHDQFDAEASSSSHNVGDSKKPIFHGVSIFVDGFTIPSSQELRGYMLKHGGRFENYFSRHRVTHIICSNLPDSKMKNLRSFSGGLPVVKPTWVLDCVAAQKKLNWVPYQLDQLSNATRNQPKLSDFFALRSSTGSQDACSDSTCLLKSEAEDSELKCPGLDDHTAGVVDENIFIKANESSECTRCSEEEIKDAYCEQFAMEDVAEQVSGDKEFSMETEKLVPVNNEFESRALSGFSTFEPEKPVIANNEPKSSPLHSATSASIHDMHMKAVGESSGSHVRGSSYHCHSTSEDPNFVENYFKSSRLHFIGTWRNRYLKRFASMSSRIKQKWPDVNSFSTSQKGTIIHVDMDCFFVAVVVRNRPELLDKPVAVCHSDSPRGTAEISSANYPARDYGVKAGMFVRDAKARCPHLLIVPYNFEAYEEVADQFYNILHKYCNLVQAVSCDEAFLDVTDCDEKDPELLASTIRKEVFETTRCTASAGIAGNLLMARLATRTAKPDGQCYIPLEKVDDYLVQLPIKALPGIGHVLEEKLKRKGVQTCGQLRPFSKESLQREFGAKTGEMLWNYCRGVDNRSVAVIRESKSVGAEVNWGVRFKNMNDCQHFLLSLCKEVSLRLKGCGVQGRTFTLKIKKRKKDAQEPVKYMGCGDCENLSHSTTVPVATDDVDFLQRITMQLFGLFHLVLPDVKDIRGAGLQVTKLEIADQTKQGNEKNTLKLWLASGSAGSAKQCNLRDTECGRSSSMLTDPSSRQTPLPSLEELDMGVIENLPPELFTEINDVYGGKLIDLVSKNRCSSVHQTLPDLSNNDAKDNALSKQEALDSFGEEVNTYREKDETGCSKENELQVGHTFGSETTADTVITLVESDNAAVMPVSLSQVDVSILQQLPEELRADIIETLPAHRSLPESSGVSTEPLNMRAMEEPVVKFISFPEEMNLWIGNPPYWVCKYKGSDCLMLNILAEFYLKSGSTGILSSVLQCCISGYSIFSEVTEDVVNEASDSLCELLRQYIQLKLETDIEEIYVCFRLLRRLMSISKAFSLVYDIILPHLQACIGERYGGNLHLSPMR